MTQIRFTRHGFMLLAAAAGLAACSSHDAEQDAAGGMAPAQVSTQVVQPRDLPLYFEYVGRLEAAREIEIRPRVTGLIEQRLFEEGGRVSNGDVLFRIDPDPFRARKQAAAAAVAEARARSEQTAREVKRLQPLAEAQAISQREYDDTVSANALAKAALAVAQAELEEARLELAYTEVTAPIDGRIGRALQVEGALVAPDGAPLALLAQVDPLYVRFSIPENERLDIDRQQAAGTLRMPPPDATRVTVLLGDGIAYEHAGQFDYRDYRSDPRTGAFESRATLPNPDARLSPGQFVRVRVEGALLPEALAVPQRAVQEDAQGKFVYVAAPNEQGMTVALSKRVEVGPWVELPGSEPPQRGWVIRGGLTAGDRVIVDGTARIYFPGMPVQPDSTAPAQAATAAGTD